MVKEMIFNGIDMSRFMRIKDIIRPIGNKRSVTTSDAPSVGVNVQQVKRGEKEHIIKFDIKTTTADEMEKLKHELAGIFDVDAAVKITYSDEPGIYYLGMPIDEITPDNIARWFQRSEFKLIIPDGVAHATEYNTKSTATISGKKVILKVDNKGNQKAAPIITVKHRSDNGYLAFYNSSGLLQLGNRTEPDKVTKQRSAMVWDYRGDAIVTGNANATKNQGVLNDIKTGFKGRLVETTEWGRKHLKLDKQDNTGEVISTISWDLGDTSLFERLWWRQVIWCLDIYQQGFIKVMFSDADGNFLYGVETFKRKQGLDAEYNFLSADGKGGYKVLRSWKFKATHWDTENPFNHTRGFSDLNRENDKVKVYWFGISETFFVPEIRNKKSAKVHVAFGSIGNYELPSHMYLDEIFFINNKENYLSDISNRYSAGTIVEINAEDDSIIVDGVKRASEFIAKSDWITIPPGKSEIEAYVSDFVTVMPEITLKFRESWL